jgi:succinate dehydrogenase / fumarate reductase, membrane anchor subunit
LRCTHKHLLLRRKGKSMSKDSSSPPKMIAFQSYLSKVRGLGSGKHGTDHWWQQRQSAVLLVPLTLWLGYGILSHLHADYPAWQAWFGHPLNASLSLLWLYCALSHLRLGLQIVIEDYIHHEGIKFVSFIGLYAFTALLGLLSALALLKLLFKSSAVSGAGLL